MNDQEYQAVLERIAAQYPGLLTATVECLCVGCWYERFPGVAFPGNSVSSTLCQRHRVAARATRRHWKGEQA
jgi:hypothetical protein